MLGSYFDKVAAKLGDSQSGYFNVTKLLYYVLRARKEFPRYHCVYPSDQDMKQG